MTDIDLRKDPRWQRLDGRPWTCATCGEAHYGLFDITFKWPDYWQALGDAQPNGKVEDAGANFLSHDFCVINREHFFVRCVLELPIIGSSGQSFMFGVWSSLSQCNFSIYVEGFDNGNYSDRGPWFSWLSNQLPGYENTLSMKCNVKPADDDTRPLLELEPIDHQLVRDAKGVTLDRLLDIYAAAGHDLRASLND
jgi:hypothetical protein